MAQSLVLKLKGLYTSLNELSEVPEGALLEADNIDISKDSIAEPRRGYERLSGGFSTVSDRAARAFFFQTKKFAHHGPLGAETTLSYLDAGSYHTVASIMAPAGVRIRELLANQNLYLTTSSGVKKLDAYNGTLKDAGAYKGLDLVASLTGSTGFLNGAESVAYRVVWGYKDANSNLVRGAPSQREIIKNTNSAGTFRNVSVVISIPAGVTTDWFYQLYRSASTTAAEPSDELGLIYEASPSSGDLIAGTLTVTDITDYSLRGETIYTAQSQDGLASQNERPPLAKDVAVFRDVTFYANSVSKHRFNLTLLAIGSPNGLVVDDTVTIAGVTYTGKSAESIGSAQFKVTTAGSAAQNIRDTALSLIRVINRHVNSTVYAYYMSGPDDKPGLILLEERAIGGAAFTVSASRSTCWNPDSFPDTSSNDTYVNGLHWSKLNQPEAVPLTNFVQIGRKDRAILRILALRDALYVFKEEGIYRVTGYYPTFDVEQLDNSAKLIASESLAILNNQIFGLTDQGVVVVSDGVRIISRPIEQDLLELLALDLSGVQTKTWGVSYETERRYYLFLIGANGDTHATQAYVFNVFTNTWVRHTIQATCGVEYENRLYIGDALSNYVLKDRKSQTYLDYADFGFATTTTAINGLIVSIASGADLAAVGDILYESSTKFAIITAVDPINSTVAVESDPGFSLAAVDVLKAISTRITWVPVTGGNPARMSHWHTAILLFKSDFNGTAYLGFTSDLSQFEESVPIAGLGTLGWGLRPWGDGPWGGTSLKRPVRQWVPRLKQRSSQLTVSFSHAYGFSPWQLQGISLIGTLGTERVTR